MVARFVYGIIGENGRREEKEENGDKRELNRNREQTDGRLRKWRQKIGEQ